MAQILIIGKPRWTCEIKYTPPTETNGETSRPKPSGKYSPAEKTERAANSRALNILFTYVDTKEFHRISTCKFAKEAWDILVTTHEGTDTVKQGKLQRITTQFEMIRMEEDETFDEFYAKLNHIVNTSYSLGEPITPFRVIKKILRSLPKRFKTKVDILESKKKLAQMSVEDIVGQFQTYELTHLEDENISTPKTSKKSIAFSSKHKESNESDSDDNYDMEALAIFTNNFKRFFKKKTNENENNVKKGRGKFESSNNKERKGVRGPPSGPKCYECHGYGHLAQNCANKKANTKVYNVKTWDDDTDSEKSGSEPDDENDGKNYLAFTGKLSKGERSESDVEEDLVDFDELKEEYDRLYNESAKITKENIKLRSKFEAASVDLAKTLATTKDLSESLDCLIQERDILKKEVVQLRTKNKGLEQLNTMNEGKINDLSIDLKNANGIFKRFNAGSKALDNILEVQKPANDRSGLGYHASSSNKVEGGQSSTIFLNERTEVKAKPIQNTVKPKMFYKTREHIERTFTSKFIPICHHCGVHGHIRPQCNKFHATHTSRMHFAHSHDYKNFIPTCHFCGVKGHTRPNCFKLYGYPNVSSRCYHVNDYGGKTQRPRHRVTPNRHSKTVNPKLAGKLIGEVENVKGRPTWMRISDMTPHANSSTNPHDDTASSGGVDHAF